jgi:putative endonuclease
MSEFLAKSCQIMPGASNY